uniref:Complement C1q subcomponent subunit A n=1 Tax=Salvator merianae TaxID=96440 RepID=A0A8D0BP42_SALMN
MATRFWVAAFLLLSILDVATSQSNVCQAPNGRDGHPGAPGRNGRPGQKGDTGEPGMSIRSATLQGTKGDPGEPGIQGTPGNRGSVGPDGPQGPPGKVGEKGQKGQVGDTTTQARTAFSASRRSPNALGNVVVFDHIITNQDQAYSGQSGEFICKTPGYYYFAFQVVASGHLCLRLMHKGNAVATFCDNNSRGILQINSGGSVLQLAQGERVWLETEPRLGNSIYSGTDADSVFSGFLLFPSST